MSCEGRPVPACDPSKSLAVDALIRALAAMTASAARHAAQRVRSPDGCSSDSTSRFARAYYTNTNPLSGSPCDRGRMIEGSAREIAQANSERDQAR